MNLLVYILIAVFVYASLTFVPKPWDFVLIALGAVVFTIYSLPTIYMYLGSRRLKRGDVEGALAKFEKARRTHRLSPRMMVYYAYTAQREARNSTLAREVLEEVLANEKLSAEDMHRAKHNLALVDWKEGKIDDALAILREITENGYATDTYGTMGVLLLAKAAESGDFSEAEALCREAYEYNDSDRTICDNLGELELAIGNPEAALEIYESLIPRRPQSPTPYYNYGRVLAALGRTEDAEDALTKALRFHFSGVAAITRADVEAALRALPQKKV